MLCLNTKNIHTYVPYFISSRAAGYRNFQTGQPDNSGGDEKCAHLHAMFDYKWNDISCKARHVGYICEVQIK